MKQTLIRIIGTILILVGAVVVLNKPIKNHFVQKTSEQYAISKITEKEIEKNEQRETTYDFDAVKPMNARAIARSQLSEKKENLPVIASVAVPSVGICLPVFKGLENDGLYYGAGTLSPDQEMGKGNYGIASHRSDQADLLFTPLEEVTLGEKIYLTDLTNVYTYNVFLVDKVDPSAVEVLDVDPTRKMVTLLTCGDLYATTRIVVQGELEQVTPIEKIDKEAAEAFDLPMKTY